jgi:metal-sulfur cluster biosynthetic enzyme
VSVDGARGGSTPSAERWQEAVQAASRTRHALPPATSLPDPRYHSADPAVDGLWLALREVADPELPVSLVDLGLVRSIRRTGGKVEVDLTFTATACPCMGFIRYDVEDRLMQEPGVERVRINEVWDVPWTVDLMTVDGRALLRSFGVAT